MSDPGIEFLQRRIQRLENALRVRDELRLEKKHVPKPKRYMAKRTAICADPVCGHIDVYPVTRKRRLRSQRCARCGELLGSGGHKRWLAKEKERAAELLFARHARNLEVRFGRARRALVPDSTEEANTSAGSGRSRHRSAAPTGSLERGHAEVLRQARLVREGKL